MKRLRELREALEIGTDGIVDAYKKATPGEVVEQEDDMPASPDEAGMAMDQAKFIGYVADEIMEYIQGNNEFPEWMQNKLSALHEKAKGMHAVMAGKYNESVEVNEAMDQKKFSAGAKALTTYAKKNGGIDKADFMKAAKMLDQIGRINILQAGQLLSQLNRFVDGLDTDVRERIYVELKKVGLVESVQESFKPHMMYDPETGKAYKADKEEDHIRMKKMGYTHEKPDMDEAKQKNWIVTVIKPINKLKKGMKVIVPARNTAEAMKKALKRMGENPAAIGSGYIDVKLDESLEEKYRKPTQAEIDADKKKDRKGKPRPSMSAKSAKKSIYKNMMGGLKEEEVDERKLTPKEIKKALASGKAKAKPKSQVSLKKAPFEIPESLAEKLTVADGMAQWIKDFQASDAPQFKGKDKEERKEMAIAAYLAAKREAKKED